jgi:hypothetical protein
MKPSKPGPVAPPQNGNIRPEAIEGLLTCLLGRYVKVRRAPAHQPVQFNAAISGIYRDDEGNARAAFSCDIGFAANAGAALTLIPPGVAAQAVAAKALEDMLEDNFREILNVCAQVLNEQWESHVALSEVCAGANLPADLTSEPKGQDLVLDVAVQGYGGGRLRVLTCNRSADLPIAQPASTSEATSS